MGWGGFVHSHPWRLLRRRHEWGTRREKYNEEVPVVFIDGRKAFKYHMDGRHFLKALAGRAGNGGVA